MPSHVAPAPTLSELDVRLIGQVDAALASYIERRDLPPNLKKAVQHALLGGGKRMRPLLVLHASLAVGGTIEEAMPAAVAIECIHAFSLVHDDLPALDNDALRRGLPTVHVAFGEAMAVLAGDALMSIAFESASASPRQPHRIVHELAHATTHMINGQVLDTLGGFRDSESSLDRLHHIHENKTGALILASCRMGAIAGGASDEVYDALSRWGRDMGLMFQIVDDLLDETQSAEHVGKAVGKDREAGKLTFPGVIGIEASQAEVRRLHAESARLIAPLGERAKPLHALADFLAHRTK